MNENIARDPILTAIFNSLTAAEGVSAAFTEVDKAGALTGDQFGEVCNLQNCVLTAESFSWREIDRLRALAASFDSAIFNETDTWFVHDECDMSGGHEESALSAKGSALIGLRSAFCFLANQLAEVVKIQEAERLAKLLTQ